MRKINSKSLYDDARNWVAPGSVPLEAFDDYKDRVNRPSLWAHEKDDSRKKKAVLTLALNRQSLQRLDTVAISVRDLARTLRLRFLYSYGDSPIRDFNKHHYELVEPDETTLREVIFAARESARRISRPEIDQLISEAYKERWFELDALGTDDMRLAVRRVLEKQGVPLR